MSVLITCTDRLVGWLHLTFPVSVENDFLSHCESIRQPPESRRRTNELLVVTHVNVTQLGFVFLCGLADVITELRTMR